MRIKRPASVALWALLVFDAIARSGATDLAGSAGRTISPLAEKSAVLTRTPSARTADPTAIAHGRLEMCFAPAALAASGSPESSSPESSTTTLRTNVWDLYKKGGFFMIPLTACSVLSLALIFERMVALRRSVVVPANFLPGLKSAAPDLRKDSQAALNYCAANDSALSRMVAAGIKRLGRGVAVAEKAIEDAGGNEALKLRRNMRFLYALGAVATLLGLIGTISGMIVAFQAYAANTGAADVHRLATGIFEAMVNTFGGLAIAIVVTMFYYYFVGRIEKLVSELNDALSKFADDFGFNAAKADQER